MHPSSFFFFVNLLIFSNLIYSQEIFGTVKDRSNNETLPYTNIAVLSSQVGTVSKSDGSFIIDLSEIPSGYDSIAFSIIGYKKRVIHKNDLFAGVIIFLDPQSVNLESVIVSPKSPEEYIRMAVENIPQNYINQPFNGTIYQRTMIRLNGKFIESSEAIVKGYIMPVTGEFKDTTRLKLLAFRYFDEQESAINSIRIKKKKEKVAIEDLDSIMINLSKVMSEGFGLYTQIDSNLIKQLYIRGYKPTKKSDKKYWFEHMVRHDDRNLLKIGFSEKVTMARETGNILLDEESLAIETYSNEIGSSSFKLKMLLWVFGIGFKHAEAVIQFKSVNDGTSWIPDLIDVHVFVDMEKNRWFARDIPIYIEINSHLSFLEIENPANDLCLEGQLIKKKKPLSTQFKSDKDNPLWLKYKSAIEAKTF